MDGKNPYSDNIMTIFPTLIYGFNKISIKTPAELFFADMDKQILKFIWKTKELEQPKQFWKKIKKEYI